VKACLQCGGPVPPRRLRYCSKECSLRHWKAARDPEAVRKYAREWAKAHHTPAAPIPAQCPECHVAFMARDSRRVYCTERCSQRVMQRRWKERNPEKLAAIHRAHDMRKRWGEWAPVALLRQELIKELKESGNV
jgi:hypothetical protein